MKTKTCTMCLITFKEPQLHFHKDVSKHDELRLNCKICTAKRIEFHKQKRMKFTSKHYGPSELVAGHKA